MIAWIAGYPKSGTTWYRLMLSAIRGSSDPNNVINSLSEDDVRYMQSACAVPWLEIPFNQRMMARQAGLLNMAYLSERHPVWVKSHSINTTIEGMLHIPPGITTGAVYMVRDPRDVAISYAHHMQCSIDEAITHMGTDDACLGDFREESKRSGGGEPVMRCLLRSWSEHVSSWALEGRPYPVQVVKYENLLDNPQKQFQNSLLGAAGIQISDELAAAAVSATRFDKLQEHEKEHGFCEKSRVEGAGEFFRKGVSGEWSQALTDDQVRRIEEDHGEVMLKLGYELSTGIKKAS